MRGPVKDSPRARTLRSKLVRLIAWATVFVAGIAYGVVAQRNELPPWHMLEAAYSKAVQELPFIAELRTLLSGRPSAGLWHRVAGTALAEHREDTKSSRQMAALEAIGYVDGSRPAPSDTGVVRYDRKRAFAGLNFYVSADAPKAYVMDMDGDVLHEWAVDFAKVWPDHPPSRENRFSRYWRRGHVFANGDLVAIHDGLGLVRVDKDSHVLWTLDNGAHHDMAVAEDGTIYVLTRETRVIPRINAREPVVEDFVARVSPDGHEISRVSLLECFENSPYASLLGNMARSGDIFHTNTLELLRGRFVDRSAAFAAGNVLISVWGLNTIAVVDLDAKRVVWALSGMWRRQHQPTFLKSGDILLFDNRGYHGRSKVIEFDPLSQEVVWSYKGTDDNPFYSEWCGSDQRLPNGNTLITESDGGRAFEVTPDKQIVWEFHSPHRAGDHDELVATLMEVVRVPADAYAPWLDTTTAGG
jgi:hypothetical protein